MISIPEYFATIFGLSDFMGRGETVIGYNALARLVYLGPDARLGAADQRFSPLWSMQVSGLFFCVFANLWKIQ